MRQSLSWAALLWLCIIFLALLIFGSATREGDVFRQYIACFAVVPLALFFLSPKEWPKVKSSRWILLGLLCVMAVGLFQLLPLGLSSGSPLSKNLQIEASILGQTAPKNISFDPQSTRRFLGLLTLLCAIWAVLAWLGPKAGRLMHFMILSMGLLGLAIGWVDLWQNPDAHFLWDDFSTETLAGPFAKSSHFGTLLLVSLGYSTYGALRNFRGRRRSRSALFLMLYCAASALFMMGIVQCGSSAILGLSIAMMTLIIMIHVFSERRIVADLLPALIFTSGIGVPIAFMGLTLTGLLPEPDNALGHSDILGRPDMWWMSGEMFKDHPFFGIGIGAFDNVSGFYANKDVITYGIADEAHSDIIQILIEGGLFLFLIYTFALYRASRIIHQFLKQHRLRESYKAPALIGVMSILGHSFVDYPAQTWVVAAILTALLTVLSAPVGDKRVQTMSPKLRVIHL